MKKVMLGNAVEKLHRICHPVTWWFWKSESLLPLSFFFRFRYTNRKSISRSSHGGTSINSGYVSLEKESSPHANIYDQQQQQKHGHGGGTSQPLHLLRQNRSSRANRSHYTHQHNGVNGDSLKAPLSKQQQQQHCSSPDRNSSGCVSGTVAGTEQACSLRRREVILARISLYIVFVFLICHGVRLFPNTFEMIQTYMEVSFFNSRIWRLRSVMSIIRTYWKRSPFSEV